MAHYTKLGVLALRSFGLVILLYAVPIVAWGLLRFGIGEFTAAERAEAIAALFAWCAYMIAGLLLLRFARPLARIVAKGLDDTSPESPAA